MTLETRHTPAVSICIPTWNRSEMLVQAVRSALAQDFESIEVFVCNNASTDDTVEAVTPFSRDRRFRLVTHGQNLGALENYRRCVALARGRYIKFLNDDDILDPDAISSMVPFLDDPAVSLVTGRWRYFRTSPGDCAPMPLPPWANVAQNGHVRALGRAFAQLCLFNTTNWAGCPTMALFRKADVRGFGAQLGLDWVFAPDYATWLFLMARGDTVWLTEPHWWLRAHEDAGSNYGEHRPIEAIECLHLVDAAREMGIFHDAASYRRAMAAALRRLAASDDLNTMTAWTDELLGTLAHGVIQIAGAFSSEQTPVADEFDSQMMSWVRAQRKHFNGSRVGATSAAL